MRAIPLRALPALVSMAALACTQERQQQGCRMIAEASVASTDAHATAIAVTFLDEDTAIAAWSANGATWAATIGVDGRLLGPARRVPRPGAIGSHEPEGAIDETGKVFWPNRDDASFRAVDLAIAKGGDRVAHLAVLEKPTADRPGGAYVAALRDEHEAIAVARIGAAGPFADRISIARAKDNLYVAWHEGAADSSRVLLARLIVPSLEIAEIVPIESAGAAAGPSIAASRDAKVIAWSRTTAGAAPGSEVVVAAFDEELSLLGSTVVASCRHLDPAPIIAPFEDGFGIVYRDDEDRDDTLEYHFRPIDRGGAATGPSARISRADGPRGPSLAVGDGLAFGAAIRSFQHNLLVGLNRFDGRGEKLGGEFQVYADKSDFVRVAIAAWGDEVLLVYVEDRQGSGRVLTGRVSCKGR